MLGQPGVTSKAMGPHCPLGYRSEPRQGRKPLGVLSVFFLHPDSAHPSHPPASNLFQSEPGPAVGRLLWLPVQRTEWARVRGESGVRRGR